MQPFCFQINNTIIYWYMTIYTYTIRTVIHLFTLTYAYDRNYIFCGQLNINFKLGVTHSTEQRFHYSSGFVIKWYCEYCIVLFWALCFAAKLNKCIVHHLIAYLCACLFFTHIYTQCQPGIERIIFKLEFVVNWKQFLLRKINIFI